MFKTWSLGRVLGVDLKAHGSLLVVLALGGLYMLVSGGLGSLLGFALVVGALVFSVTLHELGHIGVAARYGNTTRGITLTPIGGVAQLEREAQSPGEEVAVALAGPAVSFALAGLAALPLLLIGPSFVASVFFQVNLMLGLFNLIPAYPMDGGRVLRGALWSFQGYFDATWNAARAGQVFAVLFALSGLFLSPGLLLIGVFIGFQATLELARLKALRLAAQAQHAHPELGQLLSALLRQQQRAQAPAGTPSGASAWQAEPPQAATPGSQPAPFTRVTFVRGPDGRSYPVDRSAW